MSLRWRSFDGWGTSSFGILSCTLFYHYSKPPIQATTFTVGLKWEMVKQDSIFPGEVLSNVGQRFMLSSFCAVMFIRHLEQNHGNLPKQTSDQEITFLFNKLLNTIVPQCSQLPHRTLRVLHMCLCWEIASSTRRNGIKKRTRVTEQELMRCIRNQISSEEVIFRVKNQPVLWAL